MDTWNEVLKVSSKPCLQRAELLFTYQSHCSNSECFLLSVLHLRMLSKSCILLIDIEWLASWFWQVRNSKPQSFDLYKQLRSLIAGNLFSTTFNSDSQQSKFLIVVAVSLSKPLLHWWRSNGLHHDFDQSETRNFNYSTFTNKW